MSSIAGVEDLAPWKFDMYVAADIYGDATPEQLAVLTARPDEWRASLARMRHELDDNLRNARSLRGEERDQVVADLEEEQRRLQATWARVTGEVVEAPAERAPRDRDRDRDREPRGEPPARVVETAPTEPLVQVSWEPGRVIAWIGGGDADFDGAETMARLVAAGAPSTGWTDHDPVPLPRGGTAIARAISVGDVLGWLVAAGAGQLGDDLGTSVRWLGRVAIWAVEATARGAMVPQLRLRTPRGRKANASTGSYAVRWTPALVDTARLTRLAEQMPGAVAALDAKIDRRAVTRSALTGMVDAICRQAAKSVVVPAAPPRVRSQADIAEAFLGRLDGSAFDAPVTVGNKVAGDVEKWAASVTGEAARLIVQLDPPDAEGVWVLHVFAPGERGAPVPIERAIVMAGANRRALEAALTRVERLVPALVRPGGARRGTVVVSIDEAWDLMTTTGPRLRNAGFDVRVPEFTRRRATPALRAFADVADAAVGANQLANVRWSALFDDVELTADDIARLAREARPMIHSGGRWVEIDRADLRAAAAALEERADATQLTGAEMLRLALGLDRSPLAGGITIEGNTWATELLAAAARVSTEPVHAPDGFVGTLRSYQLEAFAWLGFLAEAGLGGCLALDMGLGKTPTVLAHLLEHRADGPALVIAPPAVVGNWLAEAHRFTPGLRVVVHHGANRAAPEELAAEIAGADVVISTYGTTVRDMDAIAEVQWARVILDEAQAIKNPANDTSQQLRRIPAGMRIAMTGTPIENGLGDLWAILDYTNPGLVGDRAEFIAQLSTDGALMRDAAEQAMRALNGILVFRRTKAEPEIAAELPDRIDELDHCSMTVEQIALYQAVLDALVVQRSDGEDDDSSEGPRQGEILAAITALKQICNHPAAYTRDDGPLAGRSGKLARLEEIVDAVYAAGEKVLVFTHFAEWGQKLAVHLTERTGTPVDCYHGGLSRGVRDRMVADFQAREGAGALVLSLKAGGTGLNLTAASHVVLYDRWWNPAVEDQARDRAWRIGQTRTVVAHRLVCPGTVDERVEEVVAGKRRIADLVLPKSSSLADLDRDQLQAALGIRPDALLSADLLAADEGVPA